MCPMHNKAVFFTMSMSCKHGYSFQHFVSITDLVSCVSSIAQHFSVVNLRLEQPPRLWVRCVGLDAARANPNPLCHAQTGSHPPSMTPRSAVSLHSSPHLQLNKYDDVWLLVSSLCVRRMGYLQDHGNKL